MDQTIGQLIEENMHLHQLVIELRRQIVVLQQQVDDSTYTNVVADSLKHSMCPRCNTSITHTYRIDPYIQDVYNRTEYAWICDNCYREACLDI